MAGGSRRWEDEPGRGEASSRRTLPFQLLHGEGAERCVGFHYCVSSFRGEGGEGEGRRLKTSRTVRSRGSLLLLIIYRWSSAAQDTAPQSDEWSAVNILAPKDSWVVVFP